MASSSGTFTAVDQTSGIMSVRPGASVEITLKDTGGHAWDVDLEQMIAGDYGHALVTSYRADNPSAVAVNQSTDTVRYRLRCAQLSGGDSIAYSIADVAAAGQGVGVLSQDATKAVAYPGCILSVDAADVADLQDGEPVDMWPSDLGLSRSPLTPTWVATGTTAASPTYKPLGINGVGPGVQFATATNRSMLVPQALMPQQATNGPTDADFLKDKSVSSRPGFTVMMVLQPIALADSDTVLTIAFPGTTTQLGMFYDAGSGKWKVGGRRHAADGSTFAAGPVAAAGVPQIVQWTNDYRNQRLTAWNNGTQVVAQAGFTAGLTDAAGAGWIAIGGFGDGQTGTDVLIGYLAIWNRVYTKAPLLPIARMLASRYGIRYA